MLTERPKVLNFCCRTKYEIIITISRLISILCCRSFFGLFPLPSFMPCCHGFPLCIVCILLRFVKVGIVLNIIHISNVYKQHTLTSSSFLWYEFFSILDFTNSTLKSCILIEFLISRVFSTNLRSNNYCNISITLEQ